MPEENTNRDWNSATARFWLVAALGVAAYLGLHHITQPFGGYWDDNDAELGISRYVADLHDYRGAFIFWDQEEPLFNYIQITFFHLFPDLSSMWISRISCTFIDLATIWVLYLLGKEVAGRRAGVLTAAIGSASKYLLLKVIVGMDHHDALRSSPGVPPI